MLADSPLGYHVAMANKLSEGTVHKLPVDLKKALLSNSKAATAWEDITPLARNEWICWTITVKQTKTRLDHIRRTVEELAEGQRRPCCWIGCIHRTDKSISPSVRGIIDKRAKTKTT